MEKSNKKLDRVRLCANVMCISVSIKKRKMEEKEWTKDRKRSIVAKYVERRQKDRETKIVTYAFSITLTFFSGFDLALLLQLRQCPWKAKQSQLMLKNSSLSFCFCFGLNSYLKRTHLTSRTLNASFFCGKKGYKTVFILRCTSLGIVISGWNSDLTKR